MKLSDGAIIEIRKKRAAGASLATLAQDYKISESMVSLIARGKRRLDAGGLLVSKYEIYKVIKHKDQGGERSPNAKLTNAEAKAIRIRYAYNDTTYKKLAQYYNVDITTIASIINGKTYKEANGPIKIPNRRLTDEEVKSIRNQHAKGIPSKDIAEAYGVSKSCVSRITRGKSH